MDLEGWSGGITPVIGRPAGMLSRSPELRGQPGALALALAHRLLHRRELGLEPGLALAEAGPGRGGLGGEGGRLGRVWGRRCGGWGGGSGGGGGWTSRGRSGPWGRRGR